MLSVICVCKSGEYRSRNYTQVWAERLRDMIDENLSIPHRFICLTDLPIVSEGITVIPLLHNWDAWWSKIELFRDDLPGERFLYLDLDSLVIGNLDVLVQMEGSFIAISPDIAKVKEQARKDRTWNLASGVMVWDAGYAHKVYETFNEEVMKKYAGDQDWIGHVFKKLKIKFELFPKQWITLLRSYSSKKREACKIICCSPNGWRQDIVISYKGEKFAWVEKVWKGELKI